MMRAVVVILWVLLWASTSPAATAETLVFGRFGTLTL